MLQNHRVKHKEQKKDTTIRRKIHSIDLKYCEKGFSIELRTRGTCGSLLLLVEV